MAQGTHLRFGMQSKNVTTWRQGPSEFFAFPRMPMKLDLLPDFQSKYTLEFCPWVSGPLRAQSRNQLPPCLLSHSLVICFVLFVLWSGCSVSWIVLNNTGFTSLLDGAVFMYWGYRGKLYFPWIKSIKSIAITTFNSVQKNILIPQISSFVKIQSHLLAKLGAQWSLIYSRDTPDKSNFWVEKARISF